MTNLSLDEQLEELFEKADKLSTSVIKNDGTATRLALDVAGCISRIRKSNPSFENKKLL